MAGLRFFDMALSVPLATLNASLARLFVDQAATAEWTAVIDADRGQRYDVRCGPPTLSVGTTLDDARLTFGIIEGSWQGGKVWNQPQQALETITVKLAGHSLAFSLSLAQMDDTALGNDALSIQHLYVDLARIKAVDTTAHDVDPGDPTLKAMITAFVRALQQSPAAANGSLVVLSTRSNSGSQQTGAGGPLSPTAAAYGLCADPQGAHPELLALMMCGGANLPTDVTAHVQTGPWTASASDAALIISGRRVLETLVKPALVQAMSLSPTEANAAQIIDATDAGPARLVCRKTFDDGTQDLTLFYAHHTVSSQVDASLVAGEIVINETVTHLVDFYGKLGEFALTQQLGCTTHLTMQLSNDGIRLTQLSRQPWTHDVSTTSSSGVLGVTGAIMDLFNSTPKALVLNADLLTEHVGLAGFPLAEVSLVGTQAFDVTGIRGVSDALVVDLRIR